MKKACFVLRAEPFHNGHLHIVKSALESGFDYVQLVIGSANRCCSPKNPFSFEDRKQMIRLSLDIEGLTYGVDYGISGINDYSVEQKWNSYLTSTIPKGTRYIVGYEKDKSSYYLKQCGLEFFPIPAYEASGEILNATDVRRDLFELDSIEDSPLYSELPRGTKQFIKEWVKTDEYTRLRDEYFYYKKEILKFKDYPYPDALNCPTADAVVVCSGHVLLVTRKTSPGQGLLALAGGHKNSNETFEQCAIRELKEETKIKLSERTLRKCIESHELFDNPNRSQVICKPTVAYYIVVDPNPDGSLPKVKGADDAAKAKWYPLSYIKTHQNRLFDDHADIIDYFTGCL